MAAMSVEQSHQFHSSFPTMSDQYIPEWMSQHMTGTSIMAVEFEGGVVIGADSRSTTGVYVANRVSDKLSRVTDYIYCCRSGASADTEAITDIVRYQVALHELEVDEQCLVKTAANIFKGICYNYREQVLAAIICAGWDRRNGGQVYLIPLGGMMVRQPCAIGGSGSSYIYGFVDANYRPNMDKEECVQFVTRALALAMARDGSSGGVIRLGIITENGMERRLVDDPPKFWEG
ncbi:proteasome subunit beta type-6-like [Centruroides sculpturatus]|uniref:proteasome subunit beta type-6-like n=1 Tax=Centruroides sculpturatus TaxID=218467 RepID=UPI000C6E6A74|nr:proteasome subunit beta type-6-like [Centruroides sculpturatus]